MKKYRNLILATIVSVFVLSGITSYAALSPNYGTSSEILNYFYEGYVQCQPSYNENGQHAARGYFVYRNGAEGEKWWYTDYGMNINDTNIYSVSGTYRDTLEFDAPKVSFNYKFNYIPHGSIYWPVSIEIVDKEK